MKNTKKVRVLKYRNALTDTTMSENNETVDMDITNLKGTGVVSSPPQHIKENFPSNKTLLAKDFDVQANVFLENIEEVFKEKKRAIEMQYTKMLLKIRPEILDLTFEKYLKLKNTALKPNIATPVQAAATRISASAAPNDENTKHIQSPNISSSQVRRTLRASRLSQLGNSAGLADTLETNPKPEKLEAKPEKEEQERQLVLRKSCLGLEPKIVLTKFDVNKPVNAARWPRCNEVSISLNGSPLMVPTSSQISMINLNIPLSNGRVMSILPRSMDSLVNIPEVSEEVLQQLDTIEQNIGIVKRLCMQKRRQAGLPQASTSTAMTPLGRK